MAQDPVDIEADKISGLPDDVLLDILGRLAMAGDVRTVARTSILSRRRRSLPWPQIPTVSLDIGEFFRSDDDEWRVWRSRRRRHRFVEQHEATAGLTDALTRFLAARPSARVIETLSLKLILTRRDYVRRVGDLVGAAADAGAANKTVELELVTEMAMPSVPLELNAAAARTKLGYGERFRHLVQDCPGAFRSLTKLALQNLWFDDPAQVNKLVCGCHALQHLSLSSCGLYPKALLLAIDMDDYQRLRRLPMLTIDAPQSRLQTLVCDVKLVQAPELVTLDYNAGDLLLQRYHPVSFGCAPSLQRLSVCQCQHEDRKFKFKLSELLVNIKLESLHLAFHDGKIWVQPERPSKQLRAALGGLKGLMLRNIYTECNYLLWTTFLLEAAPLLETLEIDICSHICQPRKKRRKDAKLAWEPSPGFRHHHLKQLSFRRAFHDLPIARRLMVLAPNLQVQRKQGVAASRLRFAKGSGYVDEFVRALKDGIPTSSKITLIFSELV